LLEESPLQGGRKRPIDTETDNYAIHAPRCRQHHYDVEDGRYEQLSFGQHTRPMNAETGSEVPIRRQRYYNEEGERIEQPSFGHRTQRTATENEDYGPYNALSVRYNADETRALEQTLVKLTEPILIDSDHELPTYNAPSVTYRECHATYDTEEVGLEQEASAQLGGPTVVESDDKPPMHNVPCARRRKSRATYIEDRNSSEETSYAVRMTTMLSS
jgi:hypothetical protein